MARPRTFLSDYPKMGIGFPYLRVWENGVEEHGTIYAHDKADAQRRLTQDREVETVIILDGKVRR